MATIYEISAEERRRGFYAGIGAYLLWGLMPVYLKLLEPMAAASVLAHRVLWSALLLIAIVAIIGKYDRVRAAVTDIRLLMWLLFSAAMIGGNWYLYTWAVLNERVLDTSLGYFIQPLINTALGVVLLGEKMGRWQWVATALAAVGIGVMTIAQGGIPLLSLGLATCFALYSFARNRAAVDAVTGLMIETALLAPIGIWWLLAAEGGLFVPDTGLMVLLILSGAVTSLPLGLFGHAARRLSLTALGFLQYLAPSCVFLLGVFAYDEPMTPIRLLAFAFIWAGLAAFSYGSFRRRPVAAKA
ncbi:EamA family transporter RarD [Pacificimonas sp. WHA3]|uniref:EamA family transporter RarD n=1 Tax=Pacificimonas pallii TaxID=2827236 RepID=A0ABS6SBD1_9SPHN|nr:EamA family transporter RarD [Pacificimonas pallii]MBV7255733.1 EamA family transporter RarD [Pacificimonas pallii]